MKNKKLEIQCLTDIFAQRLENVLNSLTKIGIVPLPELKELQQIIHDMREVEKYVEKSTSVESRELEKLRHLTLDTNWEQIYKNKLSETKLRSKMMSSKTSAQFLKMLVSILQPKKILELGLFSGYSALAMAEALPKDGTLISCEQDKFAAEFARNYIDSTRVAKKIKIEVGDCLEKMDMLAEKGYVFDFIFIDAKKTEYVDYIDKIVALGLVNKNSLICIDNVFMKTRCFSNIEPENKGTTIMKNLNQKLISESFFSVMLPIRDGITLTKIV